MRTLMMVDRSFATREHAMLRRVEVGLMDDGVRVVRAVPDDAPDPGETPLAPTIRYHDASWRLVNKAHARRLVRELQLVEPSLRPANAESEADLLDVVHAWGDGCWDMAIDVATATGATLVFELWSHASTRRIRPVERRLAGAGFGFGPGGAEGDVGAGDGGGRVVWLAPNARLRAAAEEQAPSWPVRAAHWGIHAEAHDVHRRQPGAPIGVSVVTSGRDEGAVRPVLDALASCLQYDEQMLVFLDETAVRSHHALWRHAERLGLLQHLSIIADMESRRDLILDTDVLVLPDALGEVRSIILDAMASGIVVAARADPYVEVTAVPDIALLVEGPTQGAWLTALRRVISDTDEMARIGARARERVVRDRPVHRQVDAILAAYGELADNPPIAFPGAL